eukprot:GHVN01023732.1.p1 GENE.GHVN01023732.1~~GHVN01023732.1.p1  ORF type:complete len:128 (-),score=21.34 GHVN01023732.1:271-654(-)
MAKKNFFAASDLKICVIGDEDTVTGFLMAGVGQRDEHGRTNYLIIDGKTRRVDIENAWKEFIERKDVGVILINQHVADSIRYLVDLHDVVIPTILEIPSKEHPYDKDKDSVMQRVKVFFGGVVPENV